MILLNMDMPTSCEECPLGNKGNIAVGCKLSEYAWAYDWGKGKLPNCPLHEVTDSDTISRRQTLEHLKKRLYESALNNDGIASKIFEEIADNRVQIWVDELPPSPTVTADTDTVSRQDAIDAIKKACNGCDDDDYGVVLCNAVVKVIKALPPSPIRPKGKWIATTSLQEGQITWKDYKCSNCSHHREKPMNFCEVCGAKMER